MASRPVLAAAPVAFSPTTGWPSEVDKCRATSRADAMAARRPATRFVGKARPGAADDSRFDNARASASAAAES